MDSKYLEQVLGEGKISSTSIFRDKTMPTLRVGWKKEKEQKEREKEQRGR